MSNNSSHKVAQNRFLDDILANNPGTIQQEKKRKKIQKNDFWGLCPSLNYVKMDPKQLKKKIHCCTWYPGRNAQKK